MGNSYACENLDILYLIYGTELFRNLGMYLEIMEMPNLRNGTVS